MLNIDTLALAKDLKKGGFDDKQTDSLVNLGRALSAQAGEQLATKDDLQLVRTDLDAGLQSVRADLDAVKTELEHKIDSVRDNLELKIDSGLENLDIKIESGLKAAKSDILSEMYKAMAVQTFALLGIGFTLFKLFG